MTEETLVKEETSMENSNKLGIFFCRDCLNEKDPENKTNMAPLLAGCSLEGKILFCLVQEFFPICENCMNRKISVITPVLLEQLKKIKINQK